LPKDRYYYDPPGKEGGKGWWSTDVTEVYSVGVGDLNGDGWLDVAASGSLGNSNTINVLSGRTGGKLRLEETRSGGVAPGSVTIISDFDGDGYQDVFVANQNYAAGPPYPPFAYLFPGNGSLILDTYYYSYDNLSGGKIAAADLNGDGRTDLVRTNAASNSVSVFLGQTDRTFLEVPTIATNPGPGPVALADFDADGNFDIATANADGSVSVFLGNGDGTFGDAGSLNVGSGLSVLGVGDFNGDGLPDVAVSNLDAVFVLLNDGIW
jgi:hypothetical protein